MDSPGFTSAVLVVQCLIFSSVSSRNEVGTISFSITSDTTAACDSGLTNAGIYAVLEYRHLQDPTSWEQVGEISISAANSSSQCQHELAFNFTYPQDFSPAEVELGDVLVQFRLLQWEHGGGYCNCWGIVPGSCRVQTASHNILLSQE